MKRTAPFVVAGVFLCGCGDPEAPPAAPGAAGSLPAATAPLGPHRIAAAEILLLHREAFEPRGSRRTRDEARSAARRVLEAARRPGANFDALCRRFSEDPAGKERGGFMGIIRRGQLADDFLALEEALFALEIGAIGGPVETPLGIHIVRRLPIREWSAAHILVRHSGSADPPGYPPLPAAERTDPQALGRAREILEMLRSPAAPAFEEIARQHSESLDRFRGGRLGIFPPGRLPRALEEAVAALPVGGIAGPVKTPYGYHLVRRLPIERVLVREIGASDQAGAEPRSRLEGYRKRLLEVTGAAREARFLAIEKESWGGPGRPPPAGRVLSIERARSSPEEERLLSLEVGELSEVIETPAGPRLYLRVE